MSYNRRTVLENNLLRRLDKLKAARLFLEHCYILRRQGKSQRIVEAKNDILFWKRQADNAARDLLREIESDQKSAGSR